MRGLAAIENMGKAHSALGPGARRPTAPPPTDGDQLAGLQQQTSYACVVDLRSVRERPVRRGRRRRLQLCQPKRTHRTASPAAGSSALPGVAVDLATPAWRWSAWAAIRQATAGGDVLVEITGSPSDRSSSPIARRQHQGTGACPARPSRAVPRSTSKEDRGPADRRLQRGLGCRRIPAQPGARANRRSALRWVILAWAAGSRSRDSRTWIVARM